MTPGEALEQHRKFIAEIGETVLVRRYSGTGPARTFVEAAVGARVVGYQPNEIVGRVIQGDRKAIAINDPSAIVPAGKVPLASLLPLSTSDLLVVEGVEMSIEGVDALKRRIAGVTIAFEIQVRG